jgi:hypothetical protein
MNEPREGCDMSIRYLSEESSPIDLAEQLRTTRGPVVTGHPVKRTGFFVGPTLAVLSITQLVAVAHGAPVSNLALTCSDENAIGQNQNACDGIWAYKMPTDALIVSAGSLGIWRRFGELIGADTVLVCTLPVEPGYYSSCRDTNGVRRIAFVRKDSIVAGGSVTVSKTGGDYTDPVTAAQNAFAGDTWCVAPQWPAQPCVMAIGEGVFILNGTLNIPQGLAVSGAGKGATMLVADRGVETAVTSIGNGRISDLTIVNNQAGGARATALNTRSSTVQGGEQLQLHDVAMHASGAARNEAIIKRVNLEILDSDIIAVGEDAIGISYEPQEGSATLTLERSSLAAAAGVTFAESYDYYGATIEITDSHVSGSVRAHPERVRLEVMRSTIVGDVGTSNDYTVTNVTDSTIVGHLGGPVIRVTNTTVEGSVSAQRSATFDRLTVQGEVAFFGSPGDASATISNSHIYSSSTAPALRLRNANVTLQQTFVQGAQAVMVGERDTLQSSSSVLVGPVSADNAAVLTCTDTYGADYELLNASCQPQLP